VFSVIDVLGTAAISRHHPYRHRPTRRHSTLATLVNASANAVQVFALIAAILFIIAGIIAFMDKTVWATLVCAGLAFLSAAVIFLT
jgi:hypothetical protein